MERKIFACLIALLVLGASSCVSISENERGSQATQLETRMFQTREFQEKDAKLIMKAIINVLQDDGYIIKNANVELGLVFASKEFDISEEASEGPSLASILKLAFSSMNDERIGYGGEDAFDKTKIVEASVNVSRTAKGCRVRANFTAKILDNLGRTRSAKPIRDAAFYKDFFAKVDKGVFLEKQGL